MERAMNSLTYLHLKMREKAVILKHDINKSIITVCLESDLKKSVDELAAKRKLLPEMLIDTIVQWYIPNFADWKYFNVDIVRKNYIKDTFKMFQVPPERQFITYQVNRKTLERLNSSKRHYATSKSNVLKYMINKYMAEIK